MCTTIETELVEIINKYRNDQGALITILHEAQELCGYLSKETQKIVARELNISLATVYGVATFYSHFLLEPTGKYPISVCLGTACYVKGAQNVLDAIKEELKIDVGEVTDDGLFSIGAARCIGACSLAPVLTIGQDVHGKVTVKDVKTILKEYYDRKEV